jgi:hypothetical protein
MHCLSFEQEKDFSSEKTDWLVHWKNDLGVFIKEEEMGQR